MRLWTAAAAGALALTALLLAVLGCDREDNDWGAFDPGAKHVLFALDTLRLVEGGEAEELRISLGMVPEQPVLIVVEADTGEVTAEPDTLLFLPIDDDWAAVRTVTVRAVEDAIDEHTHADALSLTVVSDDADYDGQGGRSIVPVWITDNDGAGVAVSETLLTLVESDAGTVSEYYDVVLESQPLDTVSVTMTAAPEEPSLHIEPSLVVFGPETWNVPQTVRLWVEMDDVDGDDFEAVLSHAATSTDPNYGPELGIAPVDLLVLDDTAPPVATLELIDLQDDVLYEANASHGIGFVITLDRPSTEQVILHLGTSDVTTNSDADYLPYDEQVVFDPQDDRARAFTLSVVDDAILEFPEELEIVISAVQNLTIGAEDRLRIAVEDDDTTALTMTTSPVDEDAGAARFLVSIPRTEMVPIEFTFVTDNGTATAGSDFEGMNEIFTIEPGYTEQIVPVVLYSDGVHEADETFSARLENLSRHATWDQAAVPCTIVGDDPQTVTLTGGEFGESDGQAVFNITLAAPYHDPVSVILNTLPGDGAGDANGQEDATSPADYGVMTGAERIIPAGETEWQFTVDLVADAAAEAEQEYFRLEIASASEDGFAGLLATATIIDDDLPCLATGDLVVDEADGTAVFRVDLEDGSGNPVVSAGDVVFFATSIEQSAHYDLDFTPVMEMITIPAGIGGIDIPVAVLDDVHDDDDETFVLLLEMPVNAGGFCTTDAPFCRIVDDEYPTLNVVAVGADRYNEGSQYGFVARLTTPRQSATTFVMNLSAGTSNGQGTDYSFTGNGLQTISAFETELPFTVDFLDDQLTGEIDEIIDVNIGGADVALAVTQIQATIVDAPLVEIAGTTANEGQTAYFPVTLDAVSTADVQVYVQFVNGTATGGSDFPTSGTGPFTIPAGSLTGNVEVPLTAGDGGDASSESFLVMLSSAENATLGTTTSAVGTIYDMDPPELSWVGPASATEGDDVPLVVALSWSSEAAVQFELVFTSGTAAAAGIDFDSSVTGPYTVPPGAVNYLVPVPTTADGASELATEDFTVTIVSPSEAVIGSPATVTGTILDADQPVLTIPSGDTVVEGGDLNFPIHLDRATIVPVTFGLSYGAGTTQGAADFDPNQTGPYSLAPGTTDTTIVISTVSDGVAEEQEIFTVRLTDDPVNAVLGDPVEAEGVIDDDD